MNTDNMTGPGPQTPRDAPPECRPDPRDDQIATLVAQLRLLGAQADALRADLARRDTEIAELSARLIETEARPADPRGLWSRLRRR